MIMSYRIGLEGLSVGMAVDGDSGKNETTGVAEEIPQPRRSVKIGRYVRASESPHAIAMR